MNTQQLMAITVVLLLALSTSLVSANSRLLFGAIQFPSSVTTIPSVRVYYGGHKIKTTAQNDTKQIIFSVPKGTHQDSFYLLITEALDFSCVKNKNTINMPTNTVNYLKVPSTQPYRLFEVKRCQAPLTFPADKASCSVQQSSKVAAPAWHVSQMALTTPDLRISDMTIVVCYNPDYVESIQPIVGTFALPTIVLKPDVIELAGGSEAKLHERSNAVLLASIDIDTIHAPLNEAIKQDQNRALIAAPAA